MLYDHWVDLNKNKIYYLEYQTGYHLGYQFKFNVFENVKLSRDIWYEWAELASAWQQQFNFLFCVLQLSIIRFYGPSLRQFAKLQMKRNTWHESHLILSNERSNYRYQETLGPRVLLHKQDTNVRIQFISYAF